MNLRLIIHLQGYIWAALALALAACGGLAWTWRTQLGEVTAAMAFGLCAALAALLAIGCRMIGRSHAQSLLRKDALALIGTSWLATGALGALPFWLILQCGFTDAYFESVSGFTTTGASVFGDLDALPRSLHLWRAITQWLGGFGVVVCFLALLSSLGASAKVLFANESSAQTADLTTARIQQGVRQLLGLYLVLTLSAIAAYWLVGVSLYESVVHSMTTVSTGGFSTRSGGIADFGNPAFEWSMILFMLLGGLHFPLLLALLRGQWRAFHTATEVHVYLLVLAAATVVVAFVLIFDPAHGVAPTTALRLSAFQVVSLMTSTGYATADYQQWIPLTHVLLLVLMLIGGCSGSTAGGAKVFRLIIAVRACLHHVERAYRPQVVRPLTLNGKPLAPAQVEATLTFLLLLTGLLLGGILLVALLEPHISLEGSVSAVIACLFNVGPAFAEFGPSQNYGSLGLPAKWVLSLWMVLGRVEIYALIVLFAPGLWRANR
jgi:trk system potassium uptake protein